MNSSSKWIKITAIAISYPSTIFVFAWLVDWLVRSNYVSTLVGRIILVLGILNSLFLMVYYAYKKKN